MEAQEAQELHEHAEHAAHDTAMRPVAFTMSVLAVLVAVVTILGHRAHESAVLKPSRSEQGQSLGYEAAAALTGWGAKFRSTTRQNGDDPAD